MKFGISGNDTKYQGDLNISFSYNRNFLFICTYKIYQVLLKVLCKNPLSCKNRMDLKNNYEMTKIEIF